MKKFLLVLTVLASISASATSLNDNKQEFLHDSDNQINLNRICGIDMISLQNIGQAADEVTIRDATSDFRSKGAIILRVCKYEQGFAVVATFEESTPVALIFN